MDSEDTETRCICGGKLYPNPDDQYGTVWECPTCGRGYVDEDLS